MLTDDSCAVCLEQLSTLQHVAASDCSQPVKADGHKPMICWLCMLEHIKTKSTCPLCRGTLTTVHKFPLQLLDALDANASLEGALESVRVGSLTQPALNLLTLDAVWGLVASALEVVPSNSRRSQASEDVILGVCAQCNEQLAYTTDAAVHERIIGACDAAIHQFVQALVGMDVVTPIRVNFPVLDARADGTYNLRALVRMLRQRDMLSAERRVVLRNSTNAEWLLQVGNRNPNMSGFVHESIYVTPILPVGHAFGRCAFCLHALVIPDGTGDQPPCSALIHQFHRFRFEHGVTIDMGRNYMGRDFRHVCDTFDSARLCLLRVLQPRDLLAARFNSLHSRWMLTRTPSTA